MPRFFDPALGTWMDVSEEIVGASTATSVPLGDMLYLEYLEEQAVVEKAEKITDRQRQLRKLRARYSEKWRTNYPEAWRAIKAGRTPKAYMFDDDPRVTDTVADTKRKQRNRKRKKRELAAMSAQVDETARMMQMVVIGGVGVILVGALALAAYSMIGNNKGNGK